MSLNENTSKQKEVKEWLGERKAAGTAREDFSE